MSLHPFQNIHWQLDKELNQLKVSTTCKHAVNELQDHRMTSKRVEFLVGKIKEGTKLTIREKRLLMKSFVPAAKGLALWNEYTV